jgi:hypothetical protein
MRRVGYMKFQSNDSMDIFHIAEVWQDGVEVPDESFMEIADGITGEDSPWINARPPEMKTVNVDGDTVTIQAWFNGELAVSGYDLTVYVEYEVAEELLDIETERPEQEEKKVSETMM